MNMSKLVTVVERMRELLPPHYHSPRHQRIMGSRIARLARERNLTPERVQSGAIEVNAWPQAFVDEILRAFATMLEEPQNDQCPYCDSFDLTELEDGRVLCESCGREHEPKEPGEAL